MGIRDDTDSAATRLADLHAYFREHPITGPEGHSFTRFACHTPPAAAGLPYQAAVVDHIDEHVAEVIQHTRAANPDAGPIPPRIQDLYDWAREHTQHAPEAVQERARALEYRHRLEHAVQAGDTSVVRPHRCPACRTLGLHWQTTLQRAVCLNRYCAQANAGTSQTWTLSALAYEHIAREKALRERAT